VITRIEIHERADGTLTFRPHPGRSARHVVLGCRRNPGRPVRVSARSDLAYVRGWDLSAEALLLMARKRQFGLRLLREVAHVLP